MPLLLPPPLVLNSISIVKHAPPWGVFIFMWPIYLATWRAGLRSRAIHAVFTVAILLVGLAFLSSYFSPRQPQTVALDVGFSGIRFSLVLFSLFWIDRLVANEIGGKSILLTLSYPVPRTHFLFGRFFGVISLLALAALVLGLMLWVVVFLSGVRYEQGFSLRLGFPYWIALFGYWCDAVVVAAFTLLISCLSTVTMLPISLGLAFAIAGKSLGGVLDYFARGADGDSELLHLHPILNVVQWVLPDLSRLDWRVWPMYGMEIQSVAWGAIAMAGGYVLILLALAAQVFSRREFA